MNSRSRDKTTFRTTLEAKEAIILDIDFLWVQNWVQFSLGLAISMFLGRSFNRRKYDELSPCYIWIEPVLIQKV